MHFQGPQAGVLLGAVFAVEGWPCRHLSGQRGHLLLLRGTVGLLMMRQCREAGVTFTAVQAVVDVLDDIRAGGI